MAARRRAAGATDRNIGGRHGLEASDRYTDNKGKF